MLNYLTVEQVTDVIGLLGIRRVLRPAFRPFLEYLVRNGALGVVLQPKAITPTTVSDGVRYRCITGGRTHLSRSNQRHLKIAPFASTKSS